MNMRFKGFSVAALALGLLLLGSPAFAAYQLTLTSGAQSVTINSVTGCVASGGASCAGASTAVPGVVTFAGSLGTFMFNTVIGLLQPPLTLPDIMDMISLNVSSGGAGTITAQFSAQDFDFQTPPLGFVMHAGGTLTGPVGSSVTYQTYLDNANTLGAETVAIGAMGPFTTPSFSGSLYSETLAAAATYSLTQTLTLSLTGAGQMSGDFSLALVPEPTAVALLGAVLLLIGAALRRRASSRA